MNREQAKEYILERAKDYLRPDRKGKGYVCPICGSGSGKHGTGITTKDGVHFSCWTGCFNNADIIDIIGLQNKLKDYNDKLQRAAEEFNITIDNDHESSPKEYQKQDKNKQYTQDSIHNSVYTTPQQQAEEEEPDYTEFFKEANKNLCNTNYHRGLSLSTLNYFQAGFVENWRHPKAPKMKPSPRLIIPTSPHSYLARYAGEGDYINYLGEVENKSKVGKVRIFHREILKKATSPIFVVEGEPDAMSFHEVGAAAVALGSLSYTKLLLAEIEKQKPTQPLIIALDNEKKPETQAKVERAVAELTEGFKRLDIPFYRIKVAPEYKDANEALEANREAFRAEVARATAQVEDAENAALEAEREQLRREAVVYSLQNFIKNIEDSKRAAFIPTGFKSLDGILDGGLYAGLYIVGAISSLGKTTFCLNIADNIAKSGNDVLIFSLEMARNELIAKSVSRITLEKDLDENSTTVHAKTTRGILTGTRYEYYTQVEKDLIQKSIASYGEYARNIYITEGIGNVGVTEIREKVQKHIRITGKAPVVVIDYLQIIAPTDIRATDKQNTDKAVLELKRLSRDYGIPVIGISSFNRDNYTSPVNLASYKESGAIEYSSDVLMGLQYEGMDYQEGEAEKTREKRIRELIKQTIKDGKNGKPQKIQVMILKNRNGSKGETLLDFYPMFNYFTERESQAGEENSNGWSKAESNYKR